MNVEDRHRLQELIVPRGEIPNRIPKIDKLLKKYPEDAMYEDGTQFISSFRYAIRVGSIKVVRVFFKNGASFEKLIDRGYTSDQFIEDIYFIIDGNIKKLKYLIMSQNGFKLNKKYWENNDALGCLILQGYYADITPKVLEVLLKYGTNPDCIINDHNNKTLLESIAGDIYNLREKHIEERHKDLIKILLKYGATRNPQRLIYRPKEMIYYIYPEYKKLVDVSKAVKKGKEIRESTAHILRQISLLPKGSKSIVIYRYPETNEMKAYKITMLKNGSFIKKNEKKWNSVIKLDKGQYVHDKFMKTVLRKSLENKREKRKEIRNSLSKLNDMTNKEKEDLYNKLDLPPFIKRSFDTGVFII